MCLCLGLVAGGIPAQASEVVKLARLVVIGKRSPSDAARAGTSEPARAGSHAPVVHGSGGTDDAGTAPAPARGVS